MPWAYNSEQNGLDLCPEEAHNLGGRLALPF